MAPEPIDVRVLDSLARDRRAAESDRDHARADRALAAAHLDRVYRDELTGALTRRPGQECLDGEIARSRRTGTPLTVTFVDVDGLKRVNDELGHASGDQLLHAVGAALTAGLRPYDLVIRYGGDEFVCVMPESTRQDATSSIQRVLGNLDLLHPSASLSVGYAELEPEDTRDRLIDRADADMYQARRLQAVTQGPPPALPALPVLPVLLCLACDRVLDVEPVAVADAEHLSHVAVCGGCRHATLIRIARRP